MLEAVLEQISNVDSRDTAMQMVRDVLSARGESYEGQEDNMILIGLVWSIIFLDKLKVGVGFTGADVAKAMIALKLVRDIADKKQDNPLDGAGYATIWLAHYLANDKPSTDSTLDPESSYKPPTQTDPYLT